MGPRVAIRATRTTTTRPTMKPAGSLATQAGRSLPRGWRQRHEGRRLYEIQATGPWRARCAARQVRRRSVINLDDANELKIAPFRAMGSVSGQPLLGFACVTGSVTVRSER